MYTFFVALSLMISVVKWRFLAELHQKGWDFSASLRLWCEHTPFEALSFLRSFS